MLFKTVFDSSTFVKVNITNNIQRSGLWMELSLSQFLKISQHNNKQDKKTWPCPTFNHTHKREKGEERTHMKDSSYEKNVPWSSEIHFLLRAANWTTTPLKQILHCFKSLLRFINESSVRRDFEMANYCKSKWQSSKKIGTPFQSIFDKSVCSLGGLIEHSSKLQLE